MPDKIRWGILATGTIAQKFATGLSVLPDAELVAVGSRSEASAAAFAHQFSIPHVHSSYEALAHDPDVDVIYVATPHSYHKENSLLCLEAGKAVLCEKPFAINAQEAAAVINFAREKGLFLMEAMWTRFLPALVKVRQLISDGTIGEPRMLQADFGYRTGFNPTARHFAPELGGGALLDVGIYPLSLASMLWGKPTHIGSAVHLGETGVDEQAAAVLSYPSGAIALISTAIRTNTPHEAWIMGTEGRIKIHAPWWVGTTLTLVTDGQEQIIEAPMVGNGYNYEAAAVMNSLRSSQTEHPLMPLDETLALMQTMDKIRAQWGLRYPGEIERREERGERSEQ